MLYHHTELWSAPVQIVKFVHVIEVFQRFGIVTTIFCHETDEIAVAVLFQLASKLIKFGSCQAKSVSKVVSVYIFNCVSEINSAELTIACCILSETSVAVADSQGVHNSQEVHIIVIYAL